MFRALKRTSARALGVALTLGGCARRSPSDGGSVELRAIPVAADRETPVADGAIAPAEAIEDAASAQEDAAVGPRRVVITATGSVVLHRRVVQIAESFREMGGLSWMLSRLAPIITPREVALVSLEGPLTMAARAPWVGERPVLGGHPHFARNLARVGFDAVIVGNNHALDQRPEGLESTIDALDQASLGAVGAGRSEDDAYTPWSVERDGLRIAVLGFTERSAFAPGGPDARAFVARELDRVIDAVRAATATADVIVVCPHWGRERSASPTAAQRAVARRLVEAGADVILGTGPSVLQTVERVTSPRGDAVIAYSLGTLVSNFGSAWHPGLPARDPNDPLGVMYDPRTREGALLRVQLEVPRRGEVTLASMSAIATWSVNFSGDIHVTPMRLADDRIRAERLPPIAAALGQSVRVRP
jgi:hypothetical protein